MRLLPRDRNAVPANARADADENVSFFARKRGTDCSFVVWKQVQQVRTAAAGAECAIGSRNRYRRYKSEQERRFLVQSRRNKAQGQKRNAQQAIPC
jgi:hypothetical protein